MQGSCESESSRIADLGAKRHEFPPSAVLLRARAAPVVSPVLAVRPRHDARRAGRGARRRQSRVSGQAQLCGGLASARRRCRGRRDVLDGAAAGTDGGGTNRNFTANRCCTAFFSTAMSRHAITSRSMSSGTSGRVASPNPIARSSIAAFSPPMPCRPRPRPARGSGLQKFSIMRRRYSPGAADRIDRHIGGRRWTTPPQMLSRVSHVRSVPHRPDRDRQ